MTPLTTRARELAARERKLYDQRTIPAVLEELADEVERLTGALPAFEDDAAQSVYQILVSEKEPPDGEHWEGWAARRIAAAFAAEADKLRAEAANIAAQRDEAVSRADVAEERLRAVEASRDGWMDFAGICIGKMKDLEAELARIRAADRTSITVRTTEAAKMRKGQAI
jgi:hypothetical protein